MYRFQHDTFDANLVHCHTCIVISRFLAKKITAFAGYHGPTAGAASTLKRDNSLVATILALG